MVTLDAVDVLEDAERILAVSWRAYEAGHPAPPPLPKLTAADLRITDGCLLQDGCYPMCTPSRVSVTARPDSDGVVIAALASCAVVFSVIAGLVGL